MCRGIDSRSEAVRECGADLRLSHDVPHVKATRFRDRHVLYFFYPTTQQSMRSAVNILSRAIRSFSRPYQPCRFQTCEHIWRGQPALSQAGHKCFSTFPRLRNEDLAGHEQTTYHSDRISPSIIEKTKRLPPYCPGCGAPSQTIASEDAGFFSLTRSAVIKFIEDDAENDDKVIRDVISNVDNSVLNELGVGEKFKRKHEEVAKAAPICDRCHNLLHHHKGVSIFHPSMDSIQSIIEESPYKHNHIYHVVDAADFPMSLIPSLQYDLRLPRLRTQNRRSKHQQFSQGRVAEVSFIVTRSDLLAPQKEQVDAMMPYLREVLRDALGRTKKNVRLGNIRCVSAKRGWWTKEVKEEIWKRGGAGWMVGKVNVGKSALYEVVFPKGRGETINMDKLKHQAGRSGGVTKRQDAAASLVEDTPETKEEDDSMTDEVADSELADTPGEIAATLASTEDTTSATDKEESRDQFDNPGTNGNPENLTTLIPENEEELLYDEDESASLLPPARKETAYPTMPIASFLPGTTASPIRIPFGNGKGELIDLPGVARTRLDTYVKPEHQNKIMMRDRVKPEQLTIKPGQSLLIGDGLIRITPTNPGLVFLAHGFTNLRVHVTSSEKAEQVQNGDRTTHAETILDVNAFGKIKRAGDYMLRWDVTKKRAGPLTDPTVAKLKAEQLPFVVYSADLVIEGVGWIELVAQVKRQRSGYRPMRGNDAFGDGDMLEAEDDDYSHIPHFDVFTPEGKFVAVRPPLSASLVGGPKKIAKSQRKSRPRQSIRSLKLSQEGRRQQLAAG